ncbi:hypothetical protein J7T55_010367 [Diaporthe amygdali]|uniref:uncharacterized protein n=1 Tax=Phomopsis amygdali TaxID=1214568 RepID=UPI0022FF0A52|nr:uncharacterized protein J7T55_010367 [Diaporthe amygdali]KAJ0115545.1 hypothetical protein J7T55_010367 [Diaporthe amygdali]
MLADSGSLYLKPSDDLALATLALSIVLSVLTLATVSLRCWLRMQEKLFGADDGMMLVGMVTFQATSCVTAYACFIGIGTHDAKINMVQYSEAHKDCAYDAVLVIGFVVTGTSILTDFACAGLPIFILWNMQMDRKMKILTWVMLALGASASLSTIVRIPYLQYWSIRADQLYNIANVIIWSMFECGIGIVAGSLSMLRRLVIQWVPQRAPDEEEPSTPLPPARSLITIGGFVSSQQTKPSTSRQFKPADLGAAMSTNRVGTYEQLSGSSAGNKSASVAGSGHNGLEMTDLGHKRRHGSDATDKRPLRETF